MIAARMNRLFAVDGRCFDVAIDHGFFGEPAFLDGIENMPRVIERVVAAQPDAVQLSPGQAPLLQAMAVANKPALVLRTDIANVYGKKLPSALYSQLIGEPIEAALRLMPLASLSTSSTCPTDQKFMRSASPISSPSNHSASVMGCH